MRYYFVGIGSNINPRANMRYILLELLKSFSKIDVSRIIETEPVNIIDDGGRFLNCIVRLPSSASPGELKSRFVKMEEHLGRDRSDGQSKVKSRPADLDILFQFSPESISVSSVNLQVEPYLHSLLLEFLAFVGVEHPNERDLPLAPGVAIELNSIIVGKNPLSILFNPETEEAEILD